MPGKPFMPDLPPDRFCCSQTDDAHVWIRVDHLLTKCTFVCAFCFLMIHTLQDGRGMIVQTSCKPQAE